jgi:aryl-alcohol dehydrogenase-like predicted oxidoreductase
VKYGKVPGVKKPVSRLVQGIIMLAKLGEERSFELLDAVLGAGINTFDSAHVYGGGECDRIFGRWVRERGIRNEIVILDKGAHHNADRRRVTPFDVTADLHDCLARLGFDAIDLFLMHRDDPGVPVGPLVEVFNRHIEDGLIGSYGGSNWSHLRIHQADEYAEEHGLLPFAVSSPHFSLGEAFDDPWGNSISITGNVNEEARHWYQKRGMALFPWSSLCGGLFSLRFTRTNLESFDDPADRLCVRCYCREDNFRRLDRAKEMAAAKGATVPQIALAYLLNHELDCYPLMAAYTPEQAGENAGAVEIELSSDERAWLDLRI